MPYRPLEMERMRQNVPGKTSLLLLLVIVFVIILSCKADDADYRAGDELCPCLSLEELSNNEIDPRDFADGRLEEIFGSDMNRTLPTYGYECDRQYV